MKLSLETNPEAQINEAAISAEDWAKTPTAIQELVLAMLVRIRELEAEVAALKEQVNRNSRNSSLPPSSDGPQVSRESKEKNSNRKQGGQPGHKGARRELVAVEQVKEEHDIKPPACRKCGHELEGEDADPYRHQVTEVPPVVVEVSEYRLHRLTCPICRVETRAELPTGVPQGAFGPRMQAMISLLSGRYHLSKRETVELMDDFFQAKLGLGTVPALEQRTSKAIREPVEAVYEYVKEQSVVNIDETGWREANQRAWLWGAATPRATG